MNDVIKTAFMEDENIRSNAVTAAQSYVMRSEEEESKFSAWLWILLGYAFGLVSASLISYYGVDVLELLK